MALAFKHRIQASGKPQAEADAHNVDLKKDPKTGEETHSPAKKTGDMHGQAMEIGTVTTRG